MCVIIHKPAGIEVPSINVLENCHNNNPHGIGMMFNDPSTNTVIIRKGFRNPQELLETIMQCEHELGICMTDVELVIHFRFATHGEISPNNCHPFPTIPIEEVLCNTNVSCSCGIAHNGIIDFVDDDPKLSDTMMFVVHYIADMDFYDIYKARNLIEYAIGTDKFIALSGTGEVLKLGEWEERIIDGCFYSNWSYITYTSGYKFRRRNNDTVWDGEQRKHGRFGSHYGNQGVIFDAAYGDDKRCDICSAESNDIYHYFDLEGWDIELCDNCYQQNKNFLLDNGEIVDERFDHIEDEDDYYEDERGNIVSINSLKQPEKQPEYHFLTDKIDVLPLPNWKELSNGAKWNLNKIPIMCPYCGTIIQADDGFSIGNIKIICRECLGKVYSSKTTIHPGIYSKDEYVEIKKERALICV